jgi:hypothetical protein
MADQCPICSNSLADGRSVVFKDDRLIHAGCWAERPAQPVEEAARPPRAPAKPPRHKGAA